MKSLIRILVLLLLRVPLFSQAPGDYILNLELIEVCGNGDNDGNSGEEYRWKFFIKGPGDASFKYGSLVGVSEAAPGSCFDADNNVSLGPSLPTTIYSNKFNISQGLIYNLKVEAEAYEKDCFASNSYNGDDREYVNPCKCGPGGTVPCPEKNDDDYRQNQENLQINLTNLEPGVYRNTTELKIEANDDNKYTFRMRYRWSPPVPEAPYIDGSTNICSDDTYTIRVNEPYPVDKYIWYENVNNDTYQICDELDNNCVDGKLNDCYNCDPLQEACDCVCADCINDPNGGDCLNECSECLVCRDEFTWNYIGTTSSNSITRTAPLINDDYQFRQYRVVAVGKNNVESMAESPNGALVTIYPRAPAIYNIPTGTNTTLTNISWYVENTNIRLEHVKCKGQSTGKFIIKNIDETDAGTGTYNFRLYKNNLQIGSVLGKNSVSEANPVTFSNLSRGNYTIRVINVWNNSEYCFRDYNFAIKEPQLAVGHSVSNPNSAAKNGYHIACKGGNDGEVELAGNGGIGSFRYSFNGSSFQLGGTFSGLTAGTYGFKVRDELGCESSDNTNVTEPSQLTILTGPEASSFLHDGQTYNISCNGGSDGVIGIEASGGVPGYSYTLFRSSGSDTGKSYHSPSHTFPGISAGTYYIQITDDNGCSLTTGNITLNDPPPVGLDRVQTYYPECIGGSDGYVEFTGKGGVSPYIFSSEGKTANGNLGTLTGFNSGSYSVNITDSKGCSGTFPFTIPVNPNPLYIEEVSVTPPVCPGTPTGSLTVKAGNGIVNSSGYSFSMAGLPSQTGFDGENITFEGIPGGDYLVEVVDEHSPACREEVIVILPDHRTDRLRLNLHSSTEPSCFGYSDGKISVIASGGDAPYTFSTDGFSFSATGGNTFSMDQLPANTSSGYTFYVRDNNANEWGELCERRAVITLDQPDPITVDNNPVPVSCFSGSDGSVEIFPNGGTQPYVITFFDHTTDQFLSSSPIVQNLGAGEYRIVVTDDHGCPQAVQFTEVYQPPPLEIVDVSATSPTCLGDDGTAFISATGGKGSIRYFMDNVVSHSGFFGNLETGTHVGYAEDDNGCRETFSFELITQEMAVTVTPKNPSCFSSEDGEINIQVSGGSPPYSFSLNGSEEGFLNSFSGLAAGSYTVEVTDNMGCFAAPTMIHLESPEPLAITIENLSETYCETDNGEVFYTITGGSPNYTEEIRSSNGLKHQNGKLPPGNYRLIISDQNGCKKEEEFTIDETNDMTAEVDILSTEYCSMGNGRAEALITGGSGNFHLIWSSGEETILAENLKSGFQNLLVNDNITGCRLEVDFLMSGSTDLNISHTSEDASCGESNGSVSLSISGGYSPYSIFWSDFPDYKDTFMENIPAGNYRVEITDSLGCRQVHYAVVNDLEGPKITDISITQPYCGKANGKISVEVGGSEGPYTFQWNNGDEQYENSGNLQLPSGEHLLTIRDKKGCSVSTIFTLTDNPDHEFEALVENLENDYCDLSIGTAKFTLDGGEEPYSQQWSGSESTTNTATDLSSGNHTVFITDAHGCTDSANFDIGIDDKLTLQLTESTPASCGLAIGTASVEISGQKGDVFIDWSNGTRGFTNESLVSGMHWAVATDQKGCTSDTLFFEIEDEDFIELRVVEIIPSSCHNSSDGVIEVDGSGLGSLQYEWNHGSSGARLEDLLSGEYTIIAIDASGCSKSLTVYLSAPDPLSIAHAELSDPMCFGSSDGSIEIFPDGGTGPYTFIWGNGVTGSKLSSLSEGDYTVEITDARGCTLSENFTLKNPSPITETGISEHEVICYGQILKANPHEWASYEWTFPDGSVTHEKNPDIIEPGEYMLTTLTNKGCEVKDTLTVEVKNDILSTEIIMPSEATLLDTIVAVDITWPLPQEVEWILPENITLLSKSDEKVEFLPSISGTHTVGIRTQLGECRDEDFKKISIAGAEENLPGGRVSELKIVDFRIFPNPSNGAFTIVLNFNHPASAKLAVIDLLTGSTFMEYNLPVKASHKLPIDNFKGNPGPYALIMEAGKIRTAKRFIVR